MMDKEIEDRGPAPVAPGVGAEFDKYKMCIAIIEGRIDGMEILLNQIPEYQRTIKDEQLKYAIYELKVILDCIKNPPWGLQGAAAPLSSVKKR